MANKRMFSKDIVESDAFLEMPATAQLLYFHLSLNADDYGVVPNPKTVQRVAGCNDDDLKILIAKRFVLAHQSGVIVIKHWKINNSLRSDRLKKSNYKDVLEGLYVKGNGAYTDDQTKGVPAVPEYHDNQMTTNCPPDDNQMTTNCPPSLGQSINQSIYRRDIGESSNQSINQSRGAAERVTRHVENVETVDNSGRPVDNSAEPVGIPDSIVSRLSDDGDGQTDGLTADASFSFGSIANSLSQGDWRQLERQYVDVVGLIDYVDEAIKGRGSQTAIKKPVAYIRSVATQAGWRRK